jgi:hypothetical protein
LHLLLFLLILLFIEGLLELSNSLTPLPTKTRVMIGLTAKETPGAHPEWVLSLEAKHHTPMSTFPSELTATGPGSRQEETGKTADTRNAGKACFSRASARFRNCIRIGKA